MYKNIFVSKINSKIPNCETNQNVNVNITGDFSLNLIKILPQSQFEQTFPFIKLIFQVEVSETEVGD